MAERLPRKREPLPLTLAVARGRVVVRQGEHTDGVWLVESGALRATSITPDGRTLTLDVIGPAEAVGEPDGRASPVTVRAIRPSRLRPAPAAIAPALLADRAARLASLSCDLAWLDVGTRLQRRLDDLAERFGRQVPGGTKILLLLSQEDLADLTGTTRESVSRALGALRAEGRVWVEGRKRYLIPSGVFAARTG